MIVTERLELMPASPEMVLDALAGRDALGAALGALVPDTWPPQYLDPPSLQFVLDRLAEDTSRAEWWLYFVILLDGRAGRTLIGCVGHKGPPSADGTVEVGYGIVSDYQRRGYATEAIRGLTARAFELPVVRRVIAETLPELTPSLGVLTKCGFRFTGDGSEPGVLRFEITRSAYLAHGS